MSEERALVDAWNSSYGRCENFLFWPGDEVVRFVARYLRRRVGIDTVRDVLPGAAASRVVDIGCGVGRNLIFGTEMGLEMYGNDLSGKAVAVAQEWLKRKAGADAGQRVIEGDIRKLPWATGYFAHAMSDSVLDSMPFEVAQSGVAEIARVTAPGGYFYCSLISGDETGHPMDFCGEVVVDGTHENGTMQSYFNYDKIRRLLEPAFEIIDCSLTRVSNPVKETHRGRWHVVSRRR